MSGMAEVLAAKLAALDELTDGDGFTYSWFDMEPADLARELSAALSAAGFGQVKEPAAVALEEAADAWREYLPAVAGYGNVQPVPVWLERRAEWRRRA